MTKILKNNYFFFEERTEFRMIGNKSVRFHNP